MYETTKEQSGSAAKRSVAEIIAKSTFAIYLFCIIFGTSLPFQPVIKDATEKTTSNVVNQLVFSTLFILSVCCILCRWKSAALIIKREKFLSLLLVWCLLSIAWSEYSFVSFKRFIQILTTVTVCLAFFCYTESPDDALKYFKVIFLLYVPLSFISVIFIPGAMHYTGTAWQGLSVGKNALGRMCLVNIIIWISAMRSDNLKENIINFIMIILSLILLIGSQSMTSIVTAFFLGCLGGIYYINNKLKSLGIGIFFIILVILTFLGISISLFLLGPDLIQATFEYFGKDTTFTGRVILWEYVMDVAKSHFFIGCGFGGFWVIDSFYLDNLYKYFVWLPNQSHNGYLDILNETGLIGLLIFLIAVITYFINVLRNKKDSLWKWLILCALIINLQESTLFRMNYLTGVLFIFSYLALYAEHIRPQDGCPDPPSDRL